MVSPRRPTAACLLFHLFISPLCGVAKTPDCGIISLYLIVHPSKDEIIGLASIAIPPSDPLEQYFLDHENDMSMNERREIDEVFFKQGPILKHNLPD